MSCAGYNLGILVGCSVISFMLIIIIKLINDPKFTFVCLFLSLIISIALFIALFIASFNTSGPKYFEDHIL